MGSLNKIVSGLNTQLTASAAVGRVAAVQSGQLAVVDPDAATLNKIITLNEVLRSGA